MGATEAAQPHPSGWIRKTRAVLAGLGRVEMFVAAVAFVVVCTVVATNAFMRAAMNSSLIWSEEVAMLAFRVSIFVGAAVIFKSNADIAVTMFVDRLPRAVRRSIRLSTYAIATCLFGLLAYLCADLWALQKNSTTLILELSRYWSTAPLLYGSLSMLLTSVYAFAEELTAPGLKAIIEFPPEPE